jgi:hypothetical protein
MLQMRETMSTIRDEVLAANAQYAADFGDKGSLSWHARMVRATLEQSIRNVEETKKLNQKERGDDL